MKTEPQDHLPQHAPGAPDREALEQAALLALGGLDPAEMRAHEAHLDECRACEAEIETLRAVAADLALSAPAVEPPPSLFGRLLDRVRGVEAARDPQPWKSWTTGPANDVTFVLAQNSAWQPLPIEGIEVRQLFTDAAADSVTMLVRMAPGTAYPPHRHGGFEECYVLEGELQVGDVTMRAGDYQCAKAGSRHPVQSTTTGCLLYIRSSMHDELLA